METHCDRGCRGVFQPSGIHMSTAHVWAFVIGDSGIAVIVPIGHLRAMLEDPSARDRAETHGAYPTRGKLINLGALLWRYKQSLLKQNGNGGQQ